MLLFYKIITALSAPILNILLKRRIASGKENAARIGERKGIISTPRPEGHLIWIHAASVGEAQSALILIDTISKNSPETNFLVTSGTVTSADLMEKRLPNNAIHQFYPLDHPCWVHRFLEHWKPDTAFWMESELWPNMLSAIKKRDLPAALINARLSDKSYKHWRRFKGSIKKLLTAFDIILAQTDLDADRYRTLGANNVIVTDNLKHCAAPLPHKTEDLTALQNIIGERPVWLYASTHAGEETLACRLHLKLKEKHPNLLTILVPRHPERRNDILAACKSPDLKFELRGEDKNLPDENTDIYIADTLGELGLFYRLSPIAVIGRCFSDDGGGGHNPIEAAQLNCAVLTGPNVQYQTQLFDEMLAMNAVQQVLTEDAFYQALDTLFSDKQAREKLTDNATQYASAKDHIIDHVMKNLKPLFDNTKRGDA